MLKAALFVDLENCFNGLNTYNEKIADSFMRCPSEWSQALSQYDTSGSGKPTFRKFTYKSIYYTNLFHQYLVDKKGSRHPKGVDRNLFQKSEFDVKYLIPLTQSSKNYADTSICVDCMSFIAKFPRLDEVFILSDDADYSPLVRELCKQGLNVYVTRITAKSSAESWTKLAKRLDVTLLTGEDFANITPVHSNEPAPRNAAVKAATSTPQKPSGPRPTADAAQLKHAIGDDYQPLRDALQNAANLRQGFLPLARVAQIVRDTAQSDQKITYWNYNRFSSFIVKFCEGADWIQYDSTSQGVRIRNNTLDLSLWGEPAGSNFTKFVAEMLALIDNPIPFYSPDEFKDIFSAFSNALRPANATVSDFMEAFSANLSAANLELTKPEAMMLFDAFAASNNTVDKPLPPSVCASAWRVRVYELARKPQWLTLEEGAKLMTKWLSSHDERPETAMREFLERTNPG